MPRALVAVNSQGRITLPSEVRRKLGIGAGTQLEVKVLDDAIQLRPAIVIPEEDRWAYAPEALASLRRALANVEAGRVFELTESQLLARTRGRHPRKRKP